MCLADREMSETQARVVGSTSDKEFVTFTALESLGKGAGLDTSLVWGLLSILLLRRLLLINSLHDCIKRMFKCALSEGQWAALEQCRRLAWRHGVRLKQCPLGLIREHVVIL